MSTSLMYNNKRTDTIYRGKFAMLNICKLDNYGRACKHVVSNFRENKFSEKENVMKSVKI